MSFSKSKKFSQYARSILPGGLHLTSSKNYTTNRKLKKPRSVTQKLSIILPIGVGISVISFIQWSNKNNLPHHINDSTMTESASNLVMQCYYYLPWRVTSRVIGWLSSIEIPQKFRPFVYNKYAEFFGVNLDEIDCDIHLFPSLSDFFVRPLKPNTRPIAMNANIVSPADGTILYLGPILTSQVKRVKGISYSLRHFLGDTKSHTSEKELTDQENDDYVKSLLKNSNNSLYQLTVYLAPGDYHRFHSATEWKIRLRRHFQDLDQSSTSHTIFPSAKSESFLTYLLSGVTNFGSDLEYDLQIPTKRTKIDVLTAEVISALDGVNGSRRNAMFLITPTLLDVGIKIEDTTLSYKTIQCARMLLREDIAKGLKNNFKTHDKYVVHWDGKMLNDLVGSKSVERLPVLLTAFGTEQLLGVPKMNSGSADNQKSVILSTLNEWGVIQHVKAMCFDTTAVNTGIHNGTCKAIEKSLGKDLIWLPCRHHIFEIILKSGFEVYWPVTSGPNIPMFGRFQKSWDQIDKTNYKSGIEDTVVADILLDQKNEISSFITQSLQLLQPRDDDEELLELSLIFLGEMPQDKVSFKRPGAVHHARWMAKGIYSLKMFIFRDEFRLSNKEFHSLRQLCIL